MAELSKRELDRYSRHILLPEVGAAGQVTLKESSVLIIGAGGLGCPSSLYLAAAGVGTIGLVDDEKVERSNLQRQVLYAEEQVGKSKVAAAAARLESLNPDIKIEARQERFSVKTAAGLVARYDVVLDCTDNFQTRYLANDAAVLARKPLVYGAIYRFEGQAAVFDSRKGPCYRCVFPEPPAAELVPNCAEAGVLGVLAGTIGMMQATETVKVILGIGEPLIGRMLIYDALDATYTTLKVQKNSKCAVCGGEPTIDKLEEISVPICATDFVSGTCDYADISAKELNEMLLHKAEFDLVDVRRQEEFDGGFIPGAVLIPLNELETRYSELEPEREIVVYCRSGMRSQQAASILCSKNFRRVKSLAKGYMGWIDERTAGATIP
jgi:Dinucleotide-utilizing enzymes involved in molybdopterin and thiamine biosynthesis family 2